MPSSTGYHLHIRRVLARQHADGVELDNEKLLRAVQEYFGYGAGSVDPSLDLAGDGKDAATMRPGGGSAQARVDATVSTLDDYPGRCSVSNPTGAPGQVFRSLGTRTKWMAKIARRIRSPARGVVNEATPDGIGRKGASRSVMKRARRIPGLGDRCSERRSEKRCRRSPVNPQS